ncbi:MAG: P-loop NTPase, partial [Nitrospira sp.]|nr:P-loop NTPase [Nitrospira sp.]
PLLAGLIPDLAGAVVVTTPSEVASNVVQKSIAYAQELGIEILGVVENMSQYRCPSCGEENPLFEGDTESMCEALNLPLLGRVPFDRSFARTFDKGEPILDGSHPTVAKYQEIAKKVHTLLDYQQVLAGKNG